MTFRALNRVFSLLVVTLASSSLVLNPPLASAAGASPKDKVKQRPAAHNVTVKDVQRILAADKGKSDKKIARQLSHLTLTERMSDATLESLERRVPGPKSHWALVALADDSVFLRPATADVLSQAPPDLQEQRRMISLTVDYLQKTIPRLPDLYATRTTVRFHGSPNDTSWSRLASSKDVVTYRDGKEVLDPRSWGKHPSLPDGTGLITKGVFGPILYTVIRDAAYGKTEWDRWEHGTTGRRAVFRYQVPQSQSHYSVAFHSRQSDKGETELGTGYHGEFAVDPATGKILRLTVQADLPMGSPIVEADIMVEYGPVKIGGKTYTCPLRSVSISLDSAGLIGQLNGLGLVGYAPPDAMLLNDVVFGSYHLFRSTAHILAGNIPAADTSRAGHQNP